MQLWQRLDPSIFLGTSRYALHTCINITKCEKSKAVWTCSECSIWVKRYIDNFSCIIFFFTAIFQQTTSVPKYQVQLVPPSIETWIPICHSHKIYLFHHETKRLFDEISASSLSMIASISSDILSFWSSQICCIFLCTLSPRFPLLLLSFLSVLVISFLRASLLL